VSPSRGIGKVGMLILTTVLGVISTYVIWRLEVPPTGLKPTVVFPPQVKVPVQTTVVGTVIDGATNRLITGAKVTLLAKGLSGSQETDSFGGYLFTVEEIEPSTQATLEIEAAGFNPLRLNRTLDEFSHEPDQLLTRAPAPPLDAGHGHGVVIGSHALAVLGPVASPATRKVRADYVRIGPRR